MKELNLTDSLIVHVIWDSQDVALHPFAEFLQSRLSRFRRNESDHIIDENLPPADPYLDQLSWGVAQSPGIPVRFAVSRITESQFELPRDIQPGEAKQHALILLISSSMFRQRDEWGPWLENQIQNLEFTNCVLIPIGNTRGAQNLCEATRRISILAGNVGHELLLQNISLVLLRRCLSGVNCTQDDADNGKNISVFLSHTKRGPGLSFEDEKLENAINDKGGEPIALSLRTYLQEETQAGVFFDRNNLPHSENVKLGIANAIEKSVVVVVLTDHFADSNWCQFELGLANSLGRPIIVLDAIDSGLKTPPLYLSNIPIVKSTVGVKRIISILLLQLLRDRYFKLRFKDFGTIEEGISQALAPNWESLVKLNSEKTHTIVYPDPPLSSAALAPLQKANKNLRWYSLLEYITARQFKNNSRHLTQLTCVLSISSLSEIELGGNIGVANVGFGQRQIDDLFCDIARVLVSLGARIAIGTDLRKDGFTDQLLDVLEKYTPEDTTSRESLASFLAWPIHTSLDKKRLDWLYEHADVYPCKVPKEAADRATTLSVWKQPKELAEAFTALRYDLSKHCNALIAFGGKLTNYKGAYPGLLEEIYTALKQQRAVYLLGGLGGASKAVFDVISNGNSHTFKQNTLLTLEGQIDANHDYEELAQQLDYVDYDDINAFFKSIGLNGLSKLNGLTVEQNKSLATSLNTLEISSLISIGLSNCRFALLN